MSKFPPLFIGGAGRSGTTLLVDMMGLHDEISPVYETGYVLRLINLYKSRNNPKIFNMKKAQFRKYIYKWSATLPIRPHSKRSHEHYVHGPHYIRIDKTYMRRLTDQLLNQLTPDNCDQLMPKYLLQLFQNSAKNDNKTYWVNKTPQNILYADVLLKWFPNMKLIHIIRDGRDVALSAMTRPWGPKTFTSSAKWWMRNVYAGMRFGKKYPNHYVQIKYEDLILHPEETFAYVMSKCSNQPFSIQMAKKIIAKAYKLDPNMIQKWKNSKHQSGIETFTNVAKPLLRNLGYL